MKDYERFLTEEAQLILQDAVIIQYLKDPFLCDDIKTLINDRSLNNSNYKDFETYLKELTNLAHNFYKSREQNDPNLKSNLTKLVITYYLRIKQQIMYILNITLEQIERWNYEKRIQTCMIVILLDIILSNVKGKVPPL